jgi:hypothetical protein
MSDPNGPGELGEALSDLLDAERAFPDEDPALRARVWGRVSRVIGAGEAGPTGGQPIAAPRPSALVSAAVGFVAGAVVGGVAVALLMGQPRSDRDDPSSRVAPASAPDTSTPYDAGVSPLLEVALAIDGGPVAVVADDAGARDARARRPRDGGSDSGAIATADLLGAERALIDLARTAIARGHVQDALAAIARHEDEFPRGRLSEERDALRVLALARAGRTDEARAHAERFREAHPTSPLLGAIDRALTAP